MTWDRVAGRYRGWSSRLEEARLWEDVDLAETHPLT
jgi:hypothetical protein